MDLSIASKRKVEDRKENKQNKRVRLSGGSSVSERKVEDRKENRQNKRVKLSDGSSVKVENKKENKQNRKVKCKKTEEKTDNPKNAKSITSEEFKQRAAEEKERKHLEKLLKKQEQEARKIKREHEMKLRKLQKEQENKAKEERKKLRERLRLEKKEQTDQLKSIKQIERENRKLKILEAKFEKIRLMQIAERERKVKLEEERLMQVAEEEKRAKLEAERLMQIAEEEKRAKLEAERLMQIAEEEKRVKLEEERLMQVAEEERRAKFTEEWLVQLPQVERRDTLEIKSECHHSRGADFNKNSEYQAMLYALDTNLVSNVESFECPICFVNIDVGEGVILHDCLHSFCKECLAGLIRHSETALVRCPFQNDDYACEYYLQDREIRYLVTTEIYEKHLQRSLTSAENQAPNSFHCKTSDCPGWCFYEDNVNIYWCPVCTKNNCLTCAAIHEGMNCRQYQDYVLLKSETDKEAKRTTKYLQEMLESKEAMRCPKCQIIIMKKDGCDSVQCSMCQTEICWVTKGPRWGPKGKGDISGGCRCNYNGIRCHPDCRNCH